MHLTKQHKPRVLWASPFGSSSTSLDPTISPHDVDTVALSKQFEALGYEVWLQEPYVHPKKRSSWPRKIPRDQLKEFKADLVLLTGPTASLGTYVFGGESEATRRRRDFNTTVEWLSNFNGEIIGFLNDPRPSFNIISYNEKRCEHPLYQIYSKCRYIAASADVVKENEQHRIIISDYWKLVDIPQIPQLTYSPKYRSVYPGVKGQNVKRLQIIRDFFEGEANVFTVGRIGQQLTEFPSLSNRENIPLRGVLDLVSNSEYALCCGEPLHTWLTPRFIQSLCSGTIAAIHPSFAGLHHLPKKLIEALVIESGKDFSNALRTQEFYEQQLIFVNELKTTAKALQL